MRRVIVLCLALALPAGAISASGRQAAKASITPAERALQELEAIRADAAKLRDPLSYVRVRAKMANIVWLHDREKARAQFFELWKYIKEQQEAGFNRAAAQSLFLSALFPRDSKMAAKMLEEATADHRPEDAPLMKQLIGRDPKLQKMSWLSSELLHADEKLAADMLQKSLSVSVTPAAFLALTKLREKNPILADYVAAQAMDGLRLRPTLVGLAGIFMMIEYVFPSRTSLAEKLTEAPDSSLKARYFSVAYDILKSSLEEDPAALLKDKRYSKPDLGVRLVYQGMVASLLAALAPEHAPDLAEETKSIASRLAPQVPPHASQSLSFLLSRLSRESRPAEDQPEMNVALALAKGELEEARKLIDGMENEDLKKVYSNVLVNVSFKDHMSRSELAEAMVMARKVENDILRATMFAQIARAAFAKKEVEFFRLIISEARASLAGSDWDGLHARALLILTAEVSALGVPETLDLLYGAVASINHSLKRPEPKEGPANPLLADLNRADSIIEAPELQQAFAQAGGQDIESALIAAHGIDDLAIGLVARLAACERPLSKKDAGAPKSGRPKNST